MDDTELPPNYLGKRSKHRFSFEEIDNDFPYKIQKELGVSNTKKISVFNYSPTYFRKKVGTAPNGTYLLMGGNIPEDMGTSYTFNPAPILEDRDIPLPPLVCVMNVGNADRIKSFKIHNLSPNDLTPKPCGCIINPDWTANNCDSNLLNPDYIKKYGGACVKLVIGADGKEQAIGIVKSIPEPCDPPQIQFEAGVNQKPNTLYLPAYQHSNSTHPRAQGYAHEDNYNCLKLYNTPIGQGVCCDSFAGGAGGGVATQKKRADGSIYYEFQESYRLYCLTNAALNKGGLSRDNFIYFCDGKKNCDGGPVYQNFARTKERKCVDYNKDPDPVTGKIIKCIVVENWLIRKFHVSGNQDCGCTGRGGAIYISGYTDIHWCQFECGFKQGKIITEDIVETEEVTYPEPINWCDNSYNDVIYDTYGNKAYIWSGFGSPAPGFANFKNIEMDAGGGLRSVGCGDEVIYECNDIP